MPVQRKDLVDAAAEALTAASCELERISVQSPPLVKQLLEDELANLESTLRRLQIVSANMATERSDAT